MDQILEDFISALRGSGIRISISESTDALRAVALMGYQDRGVLKDALSVALAKSQTEKEIFEECFERFFAFDAFSSRETESAEPLEAALDAQNSLLTQMLLSGDSAGLSVAMSNAARQVDITGIKFFTQKGLYIQKIMQQIGLEGLNRDIKRFGLEDRSQDRGKRLEAAKEALFETVRNFVERQYDLFASSATEEMIEQYLRNIGLSNVEQRDFHRMRVIVQKMAKRLNALYSRRRKTAKRGLLDFKNTLRKNITYGGLLFEPKWKKRRVDRPDVVALCDVSRSVKTVSRFLVLFLYSLNEILERIRTFIFCSNLIEVTHVFDEYPVEEAVAKIDTGTGLDIIMGRTDYGGALVDFKENWLDTVTDKTTVLILGDARNNYGDPRTEILRQIKERSKRLIWLNPESEPFWGTGDSEMNRYLPHCHLVRKCNTLNHLERLVEVLMRTAMLH
jgi:uncharacterized protein with von Willebrand factor type A (vWA) domain